MIGATLLNATMETLKASLTELYLGTTKKARRFRYGLILFDACTILFFIASAPYPLTPPVENIGLAIGFVILLDLLARLWIAPNRRHVLRQVYTIADIIVIASLVLAPFIQANFAFLRILRGLRLIHSYHLMRDLRQASTFIRNYEEAVLAAVNLFVFVFFTTSLVHVIFVEKATGWEGYVDALYFTVTTLTTTGYGDITPQTSGGKLTAVLIMVVGVALFVQLARAIIQPSKVNYECPTCGLLKHEKDAVHCKHCGEVLHIKTEGLP